MPLLISRSLSSAGIRFSGLPVPAGELGLPYGWLTRRDGTPSGFPRSTRVRYDRVGRPYYPEAVVLFPADCGSSAGTCRFPTASVLSR